MVHTPVPFEEFPSPSNDSRKKMDCNTCKSLLFTSEDEMISFVSVTIYCSCTRDLSNFSPPPATYFFPNFSYCLHLVLCSLLKICIRAICRTKLFFEIAFLKRATCGLVFAIKTFYNQALWRRLVTFLWFF